MANNAICTTYGWVVEQMEGDEIVDTSEFETRSEAENAATGGDAIALIKHRHTIADGEIERTYAYLADGQLPARFENGDPVPAYLAKAR